MAADKNEDRSSAVKHFNRAADNYEQRASVQRIIAQELAARISAADLDPHSILEIGAGTGFLTRRLVELFPQAQITAIDPAEDALRVAQQAAPAGGRPIEFLEIGLENFCTEERFDLISSSSTLQWIAPLDAAIRQMAGLLNPQGSIICSLLGQGTFGELHSSRLAAAPQKPPRRKLPGSAEIASAFGSAGMKAISIEEKRYISVYPDACSVLESARGLGFTGGDLSEGEFALNRSELRNLLSQYQRLFFAGGPAYIEASRTAQVVEQQTAPSDPVLRRAVGPLSAIPVYAVSAAFSISAQKD